MAYTEDYKRAPSASPTGNSGEEFRHVSCGSAIGCSSSQALKDRLQVITSGNDNTDTNGTEIKKQPEVVQISVKERIFIVPFDFEGDTILITINLVRWGVHHSGVNCHRR